MLLEKHICTKYGYRRGSFFEWSKNTGNNSNAHHQQTEVCSFNSKDCLGLMFPNLLDPFTNFCFWGSTSDPFYNFSGNCEEAILTCKKLLRAYSRSPRRPLPASHSSFTRQVLELEHWVRQTPEASVSHNCHFRACAPLNAHPKICHPSAAQGKHGSEKDTQLRKPRKKAEPYVWTAQSYHWVIPGMQPTHIKSVIYEGSSKSSWKIQIIKNTLISKTFLQSKHFRF